MISDERLIGWLCIMRLNWDGGVQFQMPHEVRAELTRRGWISSAEEPDWDGAYESSLTNDGVALCDLNAAEWGIGLEVLEG
ncbi:MAG: hypothetical protein ACYTGX_18355 [Planctomycetota bacterium]